MSDAYSLERYRGSRLAGLRDDWLARLTGQPKDLLPYDAVVEVLEVYEHRQLTERQSIPLDKIVGSVGRHREFTRTFRPRGSVSRDRWAGIDAAMEGLIGVPPIEVYQIGDVYFVADGNHRVSVARANGQAEIEAWVTLVPSLADLEAGDSLDEAIVKAECSHFLAQSRLAERCGILDIEFRRPGGYPKLLEEIYAYGHFLRSECEASARLTFPQVAALWYERVYSPVVEALRAQDLPSRYPGDGISDLYLEIARLIPDPASRLNAGSVKKAAELLPRRRPLTLNAIPELPGRVAGLLVRHRRKIFGRLRDARADKGSRSADAPG